MEYLVEWEFPEDSILKNYSPHTPSQNIFQATCDELGKYFSKHGFRYAKSGPHLTGVFGDLKAKLAFWSSRSNTSGRHITLEIVPSYFSNSYGKTEGTRNGYIWGVDMYDRHYECNRDNYFVVRHPYEPDSESEFSSQFDRDTNKMIRIGPKNTLKISKNINIWGIDEAKFVSLVNYLNQHFVSVCEVSQDVNLLRSFLLELNLDSKILISNEKLLINGYIKFKFPGLHNEILNGYLLPKYNS